MANETKTEPEISNGHRRYLQDVQDKLVRRHGDGRDWHHRLEAPVPCRVGKIHAAAVKAGHIELPAGGAEWTLTPGGHDAKAKADTIMAAGYGQKADTSPPVQVRTRFAVAF